MIVVHIDLAIFVSIFLLPNVDFNMKKEIMDICNDPTLPFKNMLENSYYKHKPEHKSLGLKFSEK